METSSNGSGAVQTPTYNYGAMPATRFSILPPKRGDAEQIRRQLDKLAFADIAPKFTGGYNVTCPPGWTMRREGPHTCLADEKGKIQIINDGVTGLSLICTDTRCICDDSRYDT